MLTLPCSSFPYSCVNHLRIMRALSLCWGYTMIKKKKKRHSVTETEEFKELAKELRKQVPDKKKRLQEMLDEIIESKTDNTKE